MDTYTSVFCSDGMHLRSHVFCNHKNLKPQVKLCTLAEYSCSDEIHINMFNCMYNVGTKPEHHYALYRMNGSSDPFSVQLTNKCQEKSRWRHQMETFSVWLAICAGNSPVPGEFPTQRPVTRSFDVFFYLRLNKRLSKQSWGWWFQTLSHPLWRQWNDCGTWWIFSV